MKITRVTPFLVTLPYDYGAPKPMRQGMGNWATQPILLVRVDTDAGITGWGEAFGHASSPVTMMAVSKVVAELAVGRDPSDIATLMRDLIRRVQAGVAVARRQHEEDDHCSLRLPVSHRHAGDCRPCRGESRRARLAP